MLCVRALRVRVVGPVVSRVSWRACVGVCVRALGSLSGGAASVHRPARLAPPRTPLTPTPPHSPPPPQGGSEKLSDEAIEESLEKVVKLLAYVSDKDLFAGGWMGRSRDLI